MSGWAERTPRHIHAAYVAELIERLSARDWAIIHSLARTRVLSGSDLERLHFYELSEQTRARTRRTVLARLREWRVITPLERRIGGVHGGSSGLVFALDVAGQRLLDQQATVRTGHIQRVRRPWTPSRLFLLHSLAVSSVFVSLAELARSGSFDMADFQTEPDCWWRDGCGGTLKPDGYVLLRTASFEDAWWLEIDRATESIPTLHRKLSAYLDFVHRGQPGPADITPRVLITVPAEPRAKAVHRLVRQLSSPADKLFHVTTHADAPRTLLRLLRE